MIFARFFLVTQAKPWIGWRPRLRIEYLWLGLPLVLVVWISFGHPLQLLDFWWHLKAGEIIVTSGSIPRTDLFSFTAAGKPFVLQSWLAEVLFYGGYRLGGLPLLVALNTALLVAALVPVYLLCPEAAAGRPRRGVLAATLAAWSLVAVCNVRPQVFSFVLFAVFYWVLTGYRYRQRDCLWTLPPLMALCFTSEPSDQRPLFLGCEAVRRLVYGPQPGMLSLRELGKLGLILVLTTLATLVNPETYRLYTSVWAVLQNPGSQSSVVEWQAPPINQVEGVLLFHGPFFLTVLVLLYSRYRLELTELVLFVGFAVFAAAARRNGIWFALVIAPIVARALAALDGLGILQGVRRFRSIEALAGRLRRQQEVPAALRYGLNALIASLMLALTVISSPWVYPHLDSEALGTSLWDSQTPVGAMDYLQQQGVQGNIFHPQNYGDYLIWRLWPQQRSFIDGRVHLFDQSVVQDYLQLFEDAHWQERLARYDIRYLLLNKSQENSHQMIDGAHASPEWRVLYEDKLSVLFERVQLAPEAKAPG